MKRLTALLMTALLIIASASAVSAETFVTLDGFSFYTNDNGEAVVVGYDDSSSRMELPYSLMNAKVTQIANNAFYCDESLQEVSFENATGLQKIGSNAFCNCTSVTSLTLPCLDELGFGAFQGCTGLTSLTVTEGLTTIPMQAFYDCEKLEEVTLSGTVSTIEEYAFGNCVSLGRVIVPATVASIAEGAFYGCEQLVILCYLNSAAHTYAVAHEIPFELLKWDIADATAQVEAEAFRYNGEAQYPSVSVTYNGTILREDTDYHITYDDNTEVGTAQIHITGCGDYEGDLYASFAIKNVLGDADGDGTVSIMDATIIQRCLAGLDVPDPERVSYVGDVSRRGVLEITDATFIQRWEAGIGAPYAIDTLMD